MRLRGVLGRRTSDTGSEEKLMVVRDGPAGKTLREAAGTRLLCNWARIGHGRQLAELEDGPLASLAKVVPHPAVASYRRQLVRLPK